jgi:signal transduction histidine kinase
MEWLIWLKDWFAGGERQYMRLDHCMNHDHLWITVTVLLDLAVAAGYVLIAIHWWRNQRRLPHSAAASALGNMRNIFLFCGICGYLFIPIKMIWPAWRLYDIFLFVLAYFTWKYAWSARDLKVVYSELGRTRHLVEELERSQEDARRKNAFFNAVSHDLRTPLNGITLQAELAELATQSNDTELLKQATSQIKASAKQAGEMLEALLEIARIDAGTDRPTHSTFSLDELVSEIVNGIRADADAKQLALRSEVPPGLVVRCDRLKLQRIITNLVSNAVKFTDYGSVTVSVDRSSDGFELHVTDTGVGVREDEVERLFDEFFQLHNPARDRNKGFGLGLAIARKLARTLGGDISVQSTPGRGSRFSVHVPECTASEAGVSPGGSNAGVLGGHTAPTAAG